MLKLGEKGFTLIEVMTAVAISTVVTATTFPMVLNSMKFNSEVVKNYSYLQMSANIQASLRNKEFYQRVLDKNPNLKSCAGKISNCAKTGSIYRAIPISIYSPKDDSLPVVGPSNSPVFYDQQGVRLTGDSKKAKFYLSAESIPQCKGYCPTDKEPLSLIYKLYIFEKDANLKNWEKRKEIQVVQIIRSNLEADVADKTCGDLPDPKNMAEGKLTKSYARGFSSGRLQCTWHEFPSDRLDLIGPPGFDGGPGAAGTNGAPGRDGCYKNGEYLKICDANGGMGDRCGACATQDWCA